MMKHILNKSLIVGIILLFTCSSFASSINDHLEKITNENNDIMEFFEPQENVVVTCNTYGLPFKSSTEIEMPYSAAKGLLEKINKLAEEITFNPNAVETKKLQEDVILNAKYYNLLPKDISLEIPEPIFTQMDTKQSKKGTLPINGNRGTASLCNFVTTGSGMQFPIIILPRLIPILLTPIPRAFLHWSANEGFTSCGSYLTGTGFMAGGMQRGTAFGFWGIGFSMFIPPVMAYGFIGYALFATCTAEEIEPWPPNYAPEVSAVSPIDGAENVDVSTSELSFHISDENGDKMDYTVTTNPDIGSGSGNDKPGGTYYIPISGLEGTEEYTWYVEVTDGQKTVEATFSFETEQVAPIISNLIPKDGSRHTPVDLSELSFYISDPQDDLMDYIVETVPDIGSGSGYEVGEGTYNVDVNGLDNDVEYIWYVNVTDGTNWKHEVFYFKTRPAPGLWWDENWIYRKYLGIRNVSSDYQMIIQVWKEDDHDNPESGSIDCENNCKEDFSDIRFVTFDGSECNYWIEKNNSEEEDHYANIWVKTPSSGDEQLYLYYGNSDAYDESSGYDTFIKYDDFDDYEIDEIPKASRGWSTSYENGANWWKATTNPDGTGLVMQGHSSSSDWNYQYIFQKNFAEKGEYAIHYKLYKDTGNKWTSTVYSVSREDDLAITTFHWDNSPWRIDWNNGDNYLPFNPNLSPKNGWANEEERLIFPDASLVHDGVEGIGGCKNEPIVGINSWQIYPFRKDTHDMFLDDFFIRKFSSAEPIWESFGSEETGP